MRRTFVGRLAVLAAGTALFIATASFEALAEDATGGPDLARGEELFALCSQCHGPDAGGNHMALAPAIAGLPKWYIEKQLHNFRSGVRGLHPKDTGGLRMYPMSQWLSSEDDVRAVASYVSSLPRQQPADVLDSGDATRGQGYYAVCTACHGPDGSGNQAMGAPPIAGMDDWYLEVAIQKYKAGIRGSGPGDALGPAMIGMAATLPDEQAIRDVIAYIQTLGGSKSAAAAQ